MTSERYFPFYYKLVYEAYCPPSPRFFSDRELSYFDLFWTQFTNRLSLCPLLGGWTMVLLAGVPMSLQPDTYRPHGPARQRPVPRLCSGSVLHLVTSTLWQMSLPATVTPSTCKCRVFRRYKYRGEGVGRYRIHSMCLTWAWVHQELRRFSLSILWVTFSQENMPFDSNFQQEVFLEPGGELLKNISPFHSKKSGHVCTTGENLMKPARQLHLRWRFHPRLKLQQFFLVF